MKKSLWLMLILVLALGLCLSACGGGESTEGEGEAAPEATSLIMATGGTSGTYYPYGGSLAQAITTAFPEIAVTVSSTGASAENIQLIANGEAQLAICQNDTIDYAYNGTNTWAELEPITAMTTLCSLYPEICQIVVAADSGIETVADLAGKRVSIGDIGSGVETNAKQILAAYDLTVDDIEAQNLSFSSSADAMKDKSIDAFFVTAGTPNTAIMDLSTSRDIKILAIDDATIDALIAEYPFYAKVTLTSDDYSFLTEDVNTVAVQATLIASPDLAEDVAYNIVKAIFENAESITAANAKGAFLDPAYAVQGVSIPFHPGAEKYFTEAGVL